MADLIVELADRGPRRVVRSTFALLAFDDEGGVDTARFDAQEFALAGSGLTGVRRCQARGTSTRPSDSCGVAWKLCTRGRSEIQTSRARMASEACCSRLRASRVSAASAVIGRDMM